MPLGGWPNHSSLVQKVGDGLRHLLSPLKQEKMPAPAYDMQTRVGNPRREQPTVGDRNDGVVIAGKHEGRLLDSVEPEDAWPARGRIELVRIAHHRRRVCESCGQCRGIRVRTRAPAEHLSGDP